MLEKKRKNRLDLIIWLFILSLFTLNSCSSAIPAGDREDDDFLRGLQGNDEQVTDDQVISTYSNTLIEPSEAMSFIHLSVNEGLSQGVVTAVYQDTDGFIWIGTANGLNRYDGSQFLVFKNKSDDPDSLSNNAVHDIIEDHEGDLWIATEGGLNKLEISSGMFIRYMHEAENENSLISNFVNCIQEDRDHRLWVGTAAGLDLIDPSVGTITHYVNVPQNPRSLPGNNVNTLLIDRQGRLWVGTNNGLSLFEPITQTFLSFVHDPDQPLSLSSNRVQVIVEDEQGSLWVGTQDGGLNEWNSNSGGFQRYFNEPDRIFSLSNDSITAIAVGHDGTIWVGTPNGLNRKNPNTNYFYRYSFDPEDSENRESLSNPHVTSILEDRSGALWIGTNGGGVNINDATSQRFIHIQHLSGNENSISSDSVTSILMDSYNDIWIGTTYGLNRYDQGSGTYTKYFTDSIFTLGLSSNNIQALYEDSSGMIWVGTDRGLNYYDREHDQIIQYQPDIERYKLYSLDLSRVSISAIVRDEQNHLWLGTLGWGLIKIDLSTNSFFTYTHQSGRTESIGSNVIRCLEIDRSGRLWVGTTMGGLNLFDERTGYFTHFVSEPGNRITISNDTINAILEDSRGRLWIGTNSGLDLLDPETGNVSVLHEEDGLANDLIYAIVEDQSGQLWISTGNGLSRYQPDAQIFKNFDITDGLQSNEFNVGAAYRDQWGVLYFGGANGLNIFDPSQLLINDYIPPIVLTSFRQRGIDLFPSVALQDQQVILLQWPNNYFDFSFAALSYIQQNKNQYAYILENFDGQWNLAASRRYGSYTNLPGGTYTLRVVGSNNDGRWNKEGISITIKVLPPFWMTAWFQIGLAVILIAGVLTGYRLRVRSIEQSRKKLAAQVAERTLEIARRQQAAEGLRDVLALLNSNRSLEDSLFFIACQIQKLIDSSQVILFSMVDGKYLRACVQCKKGAEKTASFLDKAAYLMRPKQEDAQWLMELAIAGKTFNTTNFPDEIRISPEALHCIDQDARAMSFTPILQGGEVFGGLVVLFRKARLPARYESYLFELFADQAALAIGNANLRARVEDLAVMTERNRLARDLHDAVTQTLFSASLIAEALPSTWENSKREGRKLLGDLRQLTRGALAEMRNLLMELRPRSVMDARLPDLLHQLAEATIGRTGMVVNVTTNNYFCLPQDVHMGLYRITQEALANTVRHAHARKAELILEEKRVEGQEPDLHNRINVILSVRDNGRGFLIGEIPPDHFGLRNMRERAQAIGAEITISSAPKKGTTIKVEWTGEEQVNE